VSDIEKLLASYVAGGLSRRNFVRRLLGLGIGMGFTETLLGASAKRALAAGNGQRLPARSPRFIMVVMDAFRADYVNLASMPNLELLMSRGTAYSNAWVGQLESYTPASHATLSTGAIPAHSGVLGFDWRDPNTGQETYTGWYDDVIAGRLEQQLRQHGVNSIPKAVKSIDPSARVVALSSEKYYAADAMGGPAADYILYGLPQGSSIVTRGIPHHLPPQTFLQRKGMTGPWPLKFGQFDEMSMTMALEALQVFDPRVLMINLPGADVYGHRVSPAATDVMGKIVKAADDQLGRLIDGLRARNLFKDTIIVVTGDHGMVGNTYQIDDTDLKDKIRAAGGDYLFHTGGNSAYIWLRNPEVSPQGAKSLVNQIGPAPFAHYQTIESGSYLYHPVARDGQSIEPLLEAAYQYLLGTFAGPLAPDIALTFKENAITRVYPKGHGEHGGATWGAQQIPLVITGPGVKRGFTSEFPARLMDVAPTVLSLLGIEPENMDGVPLADALVSPTNQQVRDQDQLTFPLTAYQKAIMARSAADIAAAQKDQPAPPPGNPGTSPGDAW
jgi:arylsulfatase A-like enzyme